MRILNGLGGIALANAYSCIKAISKKKFDAIAKYREEFVDGAHQRRAVEEGGGRPLRPDREVRRLRLQQEPFHRLRPDRLRHRLPEGPLAGRVHGRLAHQRHSRPQLQEEGLAGRTLRRLPADGHRGAAAGHQPLRSGVHRGRGQDLLRPLGHQGLRRRRRRGHRRRPRRRPLPQPLRLLPAARSGHGQPHGDRIAGQGRGAGLARRPAGAVVRGHRPRLAGRRRRRVGPPQRPEGPLRRRRGGHGRRPHGRSPRSARMGFPRAAGQGEGSPGLLLLQPSLGRARADAGRLSFAHDGGGLPR